MEKLNGLGDGGYDEGGVIFNLGSARTGHPPYWWALRRAGVGLRRSDAGWSKVGGGGGPDVPPLTYPGGRIHLISSSFFSGLREWRILVSISILHKLALYEDTVHTVLYISAVRRGTVKHVKPEKCSQSTQSDIRVVSSSIAPRRADAWPVQFIRLTEWATRPCFRSVGSDSMRLILLYYSTSTFL
jgi:hypothetical protein